MTDKNIQMTQRNAANDGWDNLNPITKAANVLASDGETVESHLADLSSQVVNKGASLIGLNDSGNKFTATNVEGAMLELFTLANDGKTVVASAITAKGVSASSADTFPTLATKIGQITTQSVLTGTLVASDIKTGKTGYSTDPLVKITGNHVEPTITSLGGKRWASGTANTSGTNFPFSVYGLGFTARHITWFIQGTEAYGCYNADDGSANFCCYLRGNGSGAIGSKATDISITSTSFTVNTKFYATSVIWYATD